MTHILFIDNDLGSLMLYEQICRNEGFQYSGFQNSRQAVDALSGLGVVDLVFLDLEMPHPNGYEVLKHLRSQSLFKSVPIVACTVHTTEVDNARDAGFSSFIIKPLNIDAFPDQIRTIISGQPIWETHFN